VTGDSRESGRDGAAGEPEPALRGGGLPLPGLKHLRLRRELSQAKLARRADLTVDYLSKIESGRRGCNPTIAQHLADLLDVDVLDLRSKYDDAQEEQQKVSRPARPARIKIAHRQVHQVYLKILLLGVVGVRVSRVDAPGVSKKVSGLCERLGG
jgi:transcriptional regulator with XRE-family HTH domain